MWEPRLRWRFSGRLRWMREGSRWRELGRRRSGPRVRVKSKATAKLVKSKVKGSGQECPLHTSLNHFPQVGNSFQIEKDVYVGGHCDCLRGELFGGGRRICHG